MWGWVHIFCWWVHGALLRNAFLKFSLLLRNARCDRSVLRTATWSPKKHNFGADWLIIRGCKITLCYLVSPFIVEKWRFPFAVFSVFVFLWSVLLEKTARSQVVFQHGKCYFVWNMNFSVSKQRARRRTHTHKMHVHTHVASTLALVCSTNMC